MTTEARILRGINDPNIRKAIRIAINAKWRLAPLGSGHVALRPPTGHQVVISTTCNGPRCYQNVRADLRRAGLAI